jgi:hypothetical protein
MYWTILPVTLTLSETNLRASFFLPCSDRFPKAPADDLACQDEGWADQTALMQRGPAAALLEFLA